VKIRFGEPRMIVSRLAFVAVFVFSSLNAQVKPTSLYERIGRYDTIAHIVDAYLKGIRSDPHFIRFTGRGSDSLRKAKQLLQDQLCALTGGPCSYIGRDMRTTHAGLGITSDEWAINMRYMANALDSAKVGNKEKLEFLAIVDSLKSSIVEGGK
jgi:hemoglobin